MATQSEYSERERGCSHAERIGNANLFCQRAPQRRSYRHASLQHQQVNDRARART